MRLSKYLILLFLIIESLGSNNLAFSTSLENVERAKTLVEKANTAKNKGLLKESLPFFEEALILMPDNYNYASEARNISLALNDMNKYTIYSKLTLEIINKNNPNSMDYIIGMQLNADVFARKNLNVEAILTYQKIILNLENNFGKNHELINIITNNLAVSAFQDNQLEYTINLLEKILNNKKESRIISSSLGYTYLFLGNVYKKLGKIDLTHLHYREALSILNKTTDYNSAAIVYLKKELKIIDPVEANGLSADDNAKANSFYEQAISLRMKQKFKESYVAIQEAVKIDPNQYKFLKIMTNESRGKDNFVISEQYAVRAIELSALNKNVPFEYSDSLRVLGDLYKYNGKNEEAIKYYEQAITVLKNSFGENHEKISHLLDEIAKIFLKDKNYEKALPIYQKVLQKTEDTIGKLNSSYATENAVIGKLLLNLGRTKEALSYLEEAKIAYKNTLVSNHPYLLSLNKDIETLNNTNAK